MDRNNNGINDAWEFLGGVLILPALIPAIFFYYLRRQLVMSRKWLWVIRGLVLALAVLSSRWAFFAFTDWIKAELQLVLYFIGHYIGFENFAKPILWKPFLIFALSGFPLVWLVLEF